MSEKEITPNRNLARFLSQFPVGSFCADGSLVESIESANSVITRRQGTVFRLEFPETWHSNGKRSIKLPARLTSDELHELRSEDVDRFIQYRAAILEAFVLLSEWQDRIGALCSNLVSVIPLHPRDAYLRDLAQEHILPLLEQLGSMLKDVVAETHAVHMDTGDAERQYRIYLQAVKAAVEFGIDTGVNTEDITEYLRAMPYQDYLQTPHWQEVRRQALERAGNRCQVCNTDKQSLHTHHRTYTNRGKELPEDVVVLCASCHKIFHDNGRLAK